MEGLARAELEQEGLPSGRMTARRFLDVRYVGQSFELTVDYPTSRSSRSSEGLARAISDSFYRAHLQRFGYADRNEPVEIVNLRLKLEPAGGQACPATGIGGWFRYGAGRDGEGRRCLPGGENWRLPCTTVTCCPPETGSSGPPSSCRWTPRRSSRPAGRAMWTPTAICC